MSPEYTIMTVAMWHAYFVLSEQYKYMFNLIFGSCKKAVKNYSVLSFHRLIFIIQPTSLAEQHDS